MKQVLFLVFGFNFLIVLGNSNINHAEIQEIANTLEISNPVILTKKSPIGQSQIKLYKEFLSNGHQISVQIPIHEKNYMKKHQHYVVVLPKLEDVDWTEINSKGRTLIVSEILSELDLKNVKLEIDEEIYFLDSFSRKLYEAYTVNKIKIARFLGQFYKNENVITFEPSNDYNPSIIKRRGNFHGIQFNAMIENEVPFVNFPKDFASKVPYFAKNQTYDMTAIAKGSDTNLHNFTKCHILHSPKLAKIS